MTTWAANWLTTDTSLCLHDTVEHYTPMEAEVLPSSAKYRGLSCTGSWLWTEWVAQQTCPILILERDPMECNASLVRLGLPEIPMSMIEAFMALPGRRVPYDALSEREWNYLLPDVPFNYERHDMLRSFAIQPDFSQPIDTSQLERVALDLQRSKLWD